MEIILIFKILIWIDFSQILRVLINLYKRIKSVQDPLKWYLVINSQKKCHQLITFKTNGWQLKTCPPKTKRNLMASQLSFIAPWVSGSTLFTLYSALPSFDCKNRGSQKRGLWLTACRNYVFIWKKHFGYYFDTYRWHIAAYPCWTHPIPTWVEKTCIGASEAPGHKAALIVAPRCAPLVHTFH